jgi:dimethylamine monooxygenase subunit A
MMTDQPDYQPYLAGAFRWRLALRPLDLQHWIEFGDDYNHEMDVKTSLFAQHPATVNANIPGSEDEASEVLEYLVDFLISTRPDWFSREGNEIVNHHRHERLTVSPNSAGQWHEHPIVICGRLIQEDLALLVERDGQLVFGAGSVAFPNRWDLTSKLGLTMSEVHAPVDRLNDQLQDPIDSFFGRLKPEKSFWRTGWGVLETDDLYQPVDGTAATSPGYPSVGDPAAGDQLFLRVERETIRRFPRTNCVLFTIRTYVRPLSHLVDRPHDAHRLADALANLPDDVRDYKRTTELTEAAVHWLQSVTS